MIKFKGCPKCRGDLYLATDIYGRYFNCLQCGFTRDLPAVADNARASRVAEGEPALSGLERKAA